MELLKQVRWQDILDIVFVAIILYRVLLIIKGTRAAQMLIGLGLLLLASLLSGYLELYTVNWMIQSLWAQIVIVLIILFQPEIRRALAQMGEARFLSAFTPAEELKSLDEIVKAAVALANRKMGALIVIEVDAPAVVGIEPTVEAPQIKIAGAKMVVNHINNNCDALGMGCLD